MTITKDSLVEMVHNEVGLNKREAKELIECFFEQIKTSLENGNDIKLSGFGNFILRNKSPRPG
jgi:integration host factor subunit alpha